MKIVLTHVIIINKRDNSPVFLSMTLSCQDRSLTRAELLYDGPISEQFRGSCARRMSKKFHKKGKVSMSKGEGREYKEHNRLNSLGQRSEYP